MLLKMLMPVARSVLLEMSDARLPVIAGGLPANAVTEDGEAVTEDGEVITETP